MARILDRAYPSFRCYAADPIAAACVRSAIESLTVSADDPVMVLPPSRPIRVRPIEGTQLELLYTTPTKEELVVWGIRPRVVLADDG